MKKSFWSAAFIFTILFSCSIAAQQQRIVNYEKNCKILFNLIPTSLDSKIPGIIESTIYSAVIVKKYYPSADFTGIIDKLNEIAEENPDPSIRVKAHLASIYLTSSNIIDITPVFYTYNYDYIYKQITEQLEKKFLVEK